MIIFYKRPLMNKVNLSIFRVQTLKTNNPYRMSYKQYNFIRKES